MVRRERTDHFVLQNGAERLHFGYPVVVWSYLFIVYSAINEMCEENRFFLGIGNFMELNNYIEVHLYRNWIGLCPKCCLSLEGGGKYIACGRLSEVQLNGEYFINFCSDQSFRLARDGVASWIHYSMFIAIYLLFAVGEQMTLVVWTWPKWRHLIFPGRARPRCLESTAPDAPNNLQSSQLYLQAGLYLALSKLLEMSLYCFCWCRHEQFIW